MPRLLATVILVCEGMHRWLWRGGQTQRQQDWDGIWNPIFYTFLSEGGDEHDVR
jgi:hypothetical protein